MEIRATVRTEPSIQNHMMSRQIESITDHLHYHEDCSMHALLVAVVGSDAELAVRKKPFTKGFRSIQIFEPPSDSDRQSN
jgi:hypothetical protein